VLEPAGPESASGDLLDACRARADVPHALAAVDLALWDLAGKRAGQPVCELLCAAPAESIEVNATITAPDRRGAASAAAAAVRAGYRCVKLKVGIGDDAGRVAAVRAAVGPDVALRLDANGAWTVEEAQRMIAALAPAGLELVEEPVRGLGATRKLRDLVAVRIAIDESASLAGALTGGVADAVCLKIARCGGISGLLAAAALVRASGAEVYIASTFDGPLGIAAGLHAAAALAPLPPCGLATLGLFADVDPEFEVRDGAIMVPRGVGLIG
jgi:L-alanine-DL-glutamate epimerase-like enolase superfamily enzyme